MVIDRIKFGSVIGYNCFWDSVVELAMLSSSKATAAAAASAATDSDDSEITEIEDSCYLALLEKVKELALERKVNSNSIMNTEALKSMSRKMPTSEEDMLKIVGVTKANFDRYGKILLDIIEGFAAAKDVVLSERAIANVAETGFAAEDDSVTPGWMTARSSESPYFQAASTMMSTGVKRKGSFRAKGSRAKRPRKRRTAGAASKTGTRSKLAAFKAKVSSPKKSGGRSRGFIPLPSGR
ncbi:hypothetical protein GE061_013246 [Apolygus lucorum]|uniref:HRDC domain-containing protein n=1 Tax=Apolygus lucorum TaxID=248454 RepID=A0A8S9XNG3_APOLU|nr:hypothetical protein GE061_013246 [Apolygus lucorum]